LAFGGKKSVLLIMDPVLSVKNLTLQTSYTQAHFDFVTPLGFKIKRGIL
jgi:hypothetical protein